METNHSQKCEFVGKLKKVRTPDSKKVKFINLQIRGEEQDEFLDFVVFDNKLFSPVEMAEGADVRIIAKAQQSKDKDYKNQKGYEARTIRLVVIGIAAL